MAIGCTSDIAIVEIGGASARRYGCGCLASFRFVNVERGDDGSHFREAKPDAASDTGCGAGNDRDFALKRKQCRSSLRDPVRGHLFFRFR